jgi:hypothetical protein
MLFRRDRTPPDVQAVVDASNLLAVSEFRLFEIAYANWYGVEGDSNAIEHQFLPYMFQERVPHYVRAFTRKVRGLEKTGSLDPGEFGIEPEDRTVRGVLRGVFYSLFIVASVTVLVLLAKVTAERLGVECMFPPCF